MPHEEVETVLTYEPNGAVAREKAAYKRLHPLLREKYHDQYVAIYGGELIDYDKDQIALFLRVKERYPNKFVWIAPVQAEPEETYVIHSPRLMGDD